MEPSISFQTLVKYVDAEDITNETSRILGLPPENNNVNSKLESQNLSTETYHSNPGVMFTQKIDPNNESKPQYRK